MTTIFQPLGNRVLAEPIEAETSFAGGELLLPEQAQERPLRGKVIAVGEGEKIKGEYVPVDVEVGDDILYAKYAGTEVEINGTLAILLNESDILGIITEYED